MEITRTFFLIVILVLLMHGTKTLGDDGVLLLDYYKETCPLAEEIVRRNVENAVLKDPLVAASLLRLHFHDCFVTVIYLHLTLLMIISISRQIIEC